MKVIISFYEPIHHLNQEKLRVRMLTFNDVSDDFNSKSPFNQVKELVEIMKIKGFKDIALINYWIE